MKKTTLQLIQEAVEESKKFPKPVIEYSFELPKHKEIKADSFFGVEAKFNSSVSKEKGYQVTYRY